MLIHHLDATARDDRLTTVWRGVILAAVLVALAAILAAGALATARLEIPYEALPPYTIT